MATGHRRAHPSRMRAGATDLARVLVTAAPVAATRRGRLRRGPETWPVLALPRRRMSEYLGTGSGAWRVGTSVPSALPCAALRCVSAHEAPPPGVTARPLPPLASWRTCRVRASRSPICRREPSRSPRPSPAPSMAPGPSTSGSRRRRRVCVSPAAPASRSRASRHRHRRQGPARGGAGLRRADACGLRPPAQGRPLHDGAVPPRDARRRPDPLPRRVAPRQPPRPAGAGRHPGRRGRRRARHPPPPACSPACRPPRRTASPRARSRRGPAASAGPAGWPSTTGCASPSPPTRATATPTTTTGSRRAATTARRGAPSAAGWRMSWPRGGGRGGPPRLLRGSAGARARGRRGEGGESCPLRETGRGKPSVGSRRLVRDAEKPATADESGDDDGRRRRLGDG